MTSYPDVLCVQRAAELLGVTQDWLQRSTCPRSKIGGKVFYLRDVCIDWVRGHLSQAAA